MIGGESTLVAMTFWELIQAYRDETGASEAWIMRKADVNKGAFSAWRKRGIPVLPPRRTLILLSEVLKVPYETLVMTILRDSGYLPVEVAIEAELRRAYRIRETIENFDMAAWEKRVKETMARRQDERVDLAFLTDETIAQVVRDSRPTPSLEPDASNDPDEAEDRKA